MLANESDFELHFSLNWEEKQFKSIFQEKEDFRTFSYFTALIDLQTTPSYNDMKHKNRNGIDVVDVESLDLVESPESNSRCLIV